MERTADRPILPAQANSQRVLPLTLGPPQVPPTLQMPSPQVLNAFPSLAAYLGGSGIEQLRVPPPAITLHEVPDQRGEFELQVHIPQELTNDPDQCKALQDAILGFIAAACPGAINGLPYAVENRSGPHSPVAIHLSLPTGKDREALDAAMDGVVKVARLLLALGGDAAKVTAIMGQTETAKSLIATVAGAKAPFTVCGQSPGIFTRWSGVPWNWQVIDRHVQQLRDAGHSDLAMFVLAAAIGSDGKERASRERPGDFDFDRLVGIERFISILTSGKVLENEHDFQSALEVLDKGLRLNDWDRPRVFKTYFVLVHFLAKNGAPEEALGLMERMCNFRFDSMRPEHEEDLRSAMEEIVEAAGSQDSPAFVARILDTLSTIPRDWAPGLGASLVEAKVVNSVLESPQRAALKEKQFEFEHDYGILRVKPTTPFDPATHGADMIEYAESLVQASTRPDHLIGFCLPVLDFLVGHFADLPAQVRQRLLALTPVVTSLVEDAVQSSPSTTGSLRAQTTTQRMQRLVEAALLQGVIDILPSLEPQQALNVAAWARQNRGTLFANLPPKLVDALLAEMPGAPGIIILQDQHPIDAQAAVAAIQPVLGPAIKQLTALFKGASLARMPQVTQVLFECWKTLTGANNLECHTLLMRHWRVTAPATAEQLQQAATLVRSARAALQASLADPKADPAAALALHAEIIDFILDNVNDFILGDARAQALAWGTEVLDEMAMDPAVTGPLPIAHPNAAAWPLWAGAMLTIRQESATPESCVLILSQCVSLNGAVPDRRSDTMFKVYVDHIIATEGETPAGNRRTNDLKAFMLWSSFRPAAGAAQQERLPFPIPTLVSLIGSLRTQLAFRLDPGVPAQEAMSALLAELLAQNEELAMEQLEGIVSSRRLMTDHPLLGVSLLLQFAAHSRAQGDAVKTQLLFARALSLAPDLPGLPDYDACRRLFQSFDAG